MIVTITLNAALDVTYTVAEFRPGTSHRVTSVIETAGGKGVNVASVLAGHGVPVLATGMAGGSAGTRIRHDLDARAIPHDFAECIGESRRTVTVLSQRDRDATAFNEPGPSVSQPEWDGFLAHLERLLRHASAAVVVASGSLPRGLATDAYAQIIEVARGAGCRTVVDASGEPLVRALASGPDVVKPNRDELLEVTGTADLTAGAAALRRLGAKTVLASAGADGLLLVGADGHTRSARIDQTVRGNPTGAGDAAVAAVAAGLAAGAGWSAILAEAVAWSAAAVVQPHAGVVAQEDIDRLRGSVIVGPLDPVDAAIHGGGDDAQPTS